MDGSGDTPRSSKATVCVFCDKTEKRTQVKGKSKHEKLQLSVPYKKEICKIAEETGNYKVLAAFITEKTCKLMHHSSCYRDFTRKKDRLHHSSPESNSESDPQRDSLSTSEDTHIATTASEDTHIATTASEDTHIDTTASEDTHIDTTASEQPAIGLNVGFFYRFNKRKINLGLSKKTKSGFLTPWKGN